LDVSVLNEKPGGRQGIETCVIPASRIHEVKDFMAQHLQGGGQVYWVCPLIESTDENGQQGAKGACVSDRFQDLQAVFQGRVGVVHGQQKGEEKRAVLEAFRSQKIQILVSTTVIEVGVDVPEATLMVIESAQQFGLAQLHQLRGRVGRGGAKSYCFLIYSYPLSDVGKQRLQAIKKSNDGFWIAEQDWRLRGGGDLLGVRQSGLPLFAFADLSVHRDLLEKAHTLAQQILKSDPLLEGKEGRPWDMLLHLFRKKREAVDLLSSA
jgi:ATP-dependent DNA helicase RecG